MKHSSVLIAAVILALAGGAASAQQVPPNGSLYNPPPPPPPPGPKIEVPVVPQANTTVPVQRAQRVKREYFGDKAIRCQEEGAAAGAGLDPGQRNARAGSCVNR